MVQCLSIIFFYFFNFCWVFQKFPFFCVTLYKVLIGYVYSMGTHVVELITVTSQDASDGPIALT